MWWWTWRIIVIWFGFWVVVMALAILIQLVQHVVRKIIPAKPIEPIAPPVDQAADD